MRQHSKETRVEIARIDDQRQNREYFIIKMLDSERFLASTIGKNLPRNWKQKFSAAAKWGDYELCASFASRHFTLVSSKDSMDKLRSDAAYNRDGL